MEFHVIQWNGIPCYTMEWNSMLYNGKIHNLVLDLFTRKNTHLVVGP